MRMQENWSASARRLPPSRSMTAATKHFNRNYIKKIEGIDIEWRKNCENYIFDLTYKRRHYTFINPYHPCNHKKWWSNNIDKFREELKKVLPLNS